MGIRAQSVGSGGPRKDAQPAEVPESAPQAKSNVNPRVLEAIQALKAKARAQNPGGEDSNPTPVLHSQTRPAPSRIVPFHELAPELQERTLGIHWDR